MGFIFYFYSWNSKGIHILSSQLKLIHSYIVFSKTYILQNIDILVSIYFGHTSF